MRRKLFSFLFCVSLMAGLVFGMPGTALADAAPDPPDGWKNIETRLYTGFGSSDHKEQCFDIPKGYSEVTILYWHSADKKWVEQKTTLQTVDGVKQICALVDANGWVAFQGKHTEGIYGCVSNGNPCPNLPVDT
jgi:hypothetical protein